MTETCPDCGEGVASTELGRFIYVSRCGFRWGDRRPGSAGAPPRPEPRTLAHWDDIHEVEA